MILPIITEGDPILRQKGKEVTDIADPAIQKLIDEMIPTMYERDGIGLAAPQVGESLQITVIVPDPQHFEEYNREATDALVLVNPRIVKHSWLRNKGEEGCLSVPEIFGIVKRWNAVTVMYQDRHGVKHTVRVKGLMARVFQHEIDHLNGILFVDKAEKTYKIQQL